MNAPCCSISVCICTRNRADELRRALLSVAASAVPAHQIVVSDDSTNDETRRMVASAFPAVTYVAGPRRGLGANRNTALRHATGSHILFIDDDVILGADFLGDAISALNANGPLTILTGRELNHGVPVPPHKLTYLGHQARDYGPSDTYETIVINAAVFPRALFDHALFDENLVYGCEEMDLSVRAVHLHGYAIIFTPDLVNAHYPSVINRDFYAPFGEASRIYVTFKRYFWVERRRLKAAMFLLIAYAHILAHDLRRFGPRGFAPFRTTAARSFGYIRLCWRNPAQYV